jgi:enamine deaminase RidA (YjgF/YER057c/UK114 family)
MAADGDREAIVRRGDEWFYRNFHASSAHRVGGTIYVSGEIGTTPEGVLPEDPQAQMRAAFQNLSTTLEAAGANWGDVVAMTSYHVGILRTAGRDRRRRRGGRRGRADS